MQNKFRVLVFVNELFGACNTPRGGYGFIVRKLLKKSLPDDEFKITVCLGTSRSFFKKTVQYSEEGIEVIRLPKWRYLAAKIVNSYDALLTIEATVDYLFSLKNRINKKVIFWIQDPRTRQDWEEIDSVVLAKEKSYWSDRTYSWVNECHLLGKVQFVTQARCLIEKAKELYHLPSDLVVDFLPNPIFMPRDSECLMKEGTKRNEVVFLGRLDSVKRGWLYCEIAKRLPEYNFYVLGGATNEDEKRKNSILHKYDCLSNLKFLGHLDGEEKDAYLRRAKILVNTSIHEALPVSFLEAFSYGVTVVSNQNPDNLVSRYGVWVGKSLGDGWEDVDSFVRAIKDTMSNEGLRLKKAEEAHQYVKTIHDPKKFKKQLVELLSD